MPVAAPQQMTALIKDRLPDLAACAALALFGLAAIWIGSFYPMGTVNRMGAGFFPVATSVMVVALAIAAAVETLMTEPAARNFKWRPLIFISAGILAWLQLIDNAGLIPSTFALILISGLAKKPFKPVSLLASAALLCLAGYLVFIWGLDMPLTLLGR